MSQSFIEVSKFGFHFLAVIRIALDNRRVVHSKAHFVAFKTVSYCDVHFFLDPSILKHIYFSF